MFKGWGQSVGGVVLFLSFDVVLHPEDIGPADRKRPIPVLPAELRAGSENARGSVGRGAFGLLGKLRNGPGRV